MNPLELKFELKLRHFFNKHHYPPEDPKEPNNYEKSVKLIMEQIELVSENSIWVLYIKERKRVQFMKKHQFALLPIIPLLLLSSCVKDGSSNQILENSNTTSISQGDIMPTEISIYNTDVTLFEGKCYDLTAIVYPTNATNKTVTWTSSNYSVVNVVDGTLYYTGLGNATITATTINGKTDTCRVESSEFIFLKTALPANVVYSINGVNKAAITVENVGFSWSVDSNPQTTVNVSISGRITYKVSGTATVLIEINFAIGGSSSFSSVVFQISSSTTFSSSGSTTLPTSSGPYNATILGYHQ